MKLNRAMAVASSFMEMEPGRLRIIAHALVEQQGAPEAEGAQGISEAVPPDIPADASPHNQGGAADEQSPGASLASMQSSHLLLTRAIDMLK